MDERNIINVTKQLFRLNIILLFLVFCHSADVNALIPLKTQKEKAKGTDIKLLYRMANNYFESRDYERAGTYYDSVISISVTKYPLAYYRKGIVCMNLQKYDAAKESFTKFRKYFRGKDRLNYKKLAAIYAANSDWAKAKGDTNGNIIITHQIKGLNNSGIDFSPSPVDDNTIIYGASGSGSNAQENDVRQIYKAEKINGKWQSAGLLEGKINNPDFNTGNAVISDDGKRMFFTMSRKNWQNKLISEIYVSQREGDQWQAPGKLPYPVNREDYTATQPAPGRNFRTGIDILYFVSDRPGGRGGMDIWYSQYNKRTGSYSDPIALSNKINSVGDECTPFYDISTQTLYFSSNGRKNGLGGYDIYKATGSAGTWTDAVPMPKPVNSSFDDYYFSIMKNNREGFFSSNRPGSLTLDNGTCCDDIYSFYKNECVKIYSWGTVRNAVNYDFYDNLNEKYHLGLLYPEANSTIPEVPVELYLTDENGNDEIFIGKTTTDRNGTYNFDLETEKQYKVLVKNYGYMEKRVSASTHNIFCSDTVKFGTTFIAYLPKITIKLNIYYDFDNYKLRDSARQVIDSMVMPLFDIFPNGIVEIGSHTDNKGTDEYNTNLSQKRSESVVSYLISRGISPERLVAKGYGMRNPIAPNTNSDGTDNPEGRQLNRRTEFKIVGEVSKFYRDEY
jgi:outer membrane protein OmpA-like peptidoglycan-associated protein